MYFWTKILLLLGVMHIGLVLSMPMQNATPAAKKPSKGTPSKPPGLIKGYLKYKFGNTESEASIAGRAFEAKAEAMGKRLSRPDRADILTYGRDVRKAAQKDSKEHGLAQAVKDYRNLIARLPKDIQPEATRAFDANLKEWGYTKESNPDFYKPGVSS